ncbi:hypothetical protein IIA95_01730 [Patescibacteria group bacterium]|nr:hypothetical protein [Patescibacteria group bacterium]
MSKTIKTILSCFLFAFGILVAFHGYILLTKPSPESVSWTLDIPPNAEIYHYDVVKPGITFKIEVDIDEIKKFYGYGKPIIVVGNGPSGPTAEYWVRGDNNNVFYHATRYFPASWPLGFKSGRVEVNNPVITLYPKRNASLGYFVIFVGLFIFLTRTGLMKKGLDRLLKPPTIT